MPKNDPLATLAKDVAADHTLAKARGEVGQTIPANDTPATEEADPSIVGEFDSYEAVREFDPALKRGDFAVVNGAFCRFNGATWDTVVQDLAGQHMPAADHSEAFANTVYAIERVVMAASFESGSLLGGLRDTILSMFKARDRGWTQYSQAEQRDLAKQIENHCKELIAKVTRVVVEGEEISVTGKLEKYTHSGGFDLKISAESDEDVALQLFRMQGHNIVILSADAKRFLQAEAAETQPDEPELFGGASVEVLAEIPYKAPEPAPLPTPPADDSDLADGADDETEEVETPAPAPLAKPTFGNGTIVNPDGANEYESRQNPDDFTEATESELAAQEGRPVDDVKTAPAAPAADYESESKPEGATPGQTWMRESDPRLRYLHPNMKWYLAAPTPEALADWKAAQEPAGETAGDELPDDEGGLPPID